MNGDDLTPLESLPVVVPRDELRPLYEALIQRAADLKDARRERGEIVAELRRFRAQAHAALISVQSHDVEGAARALRDCLSDAGPDAREAVVIADLALLRSGELEVTEVSGETLVGVEFVDAWIAEKLVVVDSGRIIVPNEEALRIEDEARRRGLTIERIER